jgi:Protein of unknown function (DUF3040)
MSPCAETTRRAPHLIRWTATSGKARVGDELTVARTMRTRLVAIPGRLVNRAGAPSCDSAPIHEASVKRPPASTTDRHPVAIANRRSLTPAKLRRATHASLPTISEIRKEQHMNGRDTSQLQEIEAAVELDDPELARTFRRLRRQDARCAIAAFALLAAGTVLAVTGRSTRSLLLTGAGLGLLVASPVLDRRRQ